MRFGLALASIIALGMFGIRVAISKINYRRPPDASVSRP
jgi:hypothetical protein